MGRAGENLELRFGLERVLLTHVAVQAFLLDGGGHADGVVVLKAPRWLDDSVILGVPRSGSCAGSDPRPAAKLLPDQYPVASHILACRGLLDEIAQAGLAPAIHRVRHVRSGDARPLLVVEFDFVSGTPLPTALHELPEQSAAIKAAVHACIAGLLDHGVHPFVRDLSDFVLSEERDGWVCRMVDHNAMWDCRRSSPASRSAALANVLFVLERQIINGTPYRGVRDGA